MDGLTEGRIVHFVLPSGVHRPAIIVAVWNQTTGTSNLQVFLDGTNDKGAFDGVENPPDVSKGIMWGLSADYSETPRPHSWHWIEKA
jgi:hypothetical protein